MVLEKTLGSPKEIQPDHPKVNQSWIFFGRTDAEAEAPILWPPDVKSWLTGKDSDAGKDWRQEKKGRQRWDDWMVSPSMVMDGDIDREACRDAVHGIAKGQTWSRDWTTTMLITQGHTANKNPTNAGLQNL